MMKKMLIASAAVLGLIGFGAGSRADDKEAAPPRMFRIEIKIVEYDAEGKKDTLSSPTLVTLDNQAGRAFVGQVLEHPEEGPNAKYIAVGCSAEIVVRPLPGGKVRLDATIQHSWQEPSLKSKIRIRTNSVRMMETVRFGQTVREELDNDPDTGGARAVEITVFDGDDAKKLTPPGN
jgi:hypothetical protein